VSVLLSTLPLYLHNMPESNKTNPNDNPRRRASTASKWQPSCSSLGCGTVMSMLKVNARGDRANAMLQKPFLGFEHWSQIDPTVSSQFPSHTINCDHSEKPATSHFVIWDASHVKPCNESRTIGTLFARRDTLWSHMYVQSSLPLAQLTRPGPTKNARKL
jgi:hypothetical protein